MPQNNQWLIPALLGAFFAAIVTITTKKAVGNEVVGINPSAVILIRGIVITVLFVGVLTYEKIWPSFFTGGRPLMWAIVSGVAAAASWFFGYWALKLSTVSKSYPIDKLSVAMAVLLGVLLLGDKVSITNWIGVAAMIGGAILATKSG